MKRDKPNNIVPGLQSEIDVAVSMLSPAWNWKRPIRAYVVNSRRGRSYPRQHMVSVPLWAYRKGADYFLYYVAHEMTHLLSGAKNHTRWFYKTFIDVCPVEFQHFELGYKPSSAHYGIPPAQGPGKS